MLSIEDIATRLKDRNLAKVAEAVKLSYPVVHKIANATSTTDASYSTVKKLSDYLEQNP